MRLFVAVPLGAEARDALAERLAPARRAAPPGLRWIAPENWHFTLQFLGHTEEAAVAPLQAALRAAASARAPFAIALEAAGAFPNQHHARVVWVGVAAGAVELSALADGVTRATAALGFAAEARAFQPHLTVARLKRPASVERTLAAMTFSEVRQAVRNIVLYRSHLAQSGARYEALARFPLGR